MKIKENKGITLIALVITIIVLLILAGVTINMVLGDNGIIGQAQHAKQVQENADAKDAIEIAKGEAAIASYGTQTPMTEEAISNLKKSDGITSLFNFTDNQYQNNVAKVEEEVPIPIGFAYVEGTKKNDGLIIVDGEENEFVWVPVDNPIYDSENNPTGMFAKVGTTYTGKLYDWYSWTGETDNPGEMDGDYKEPKDDIQDEYNAMAKSVETYGGFYVGRYETSWTGTKVASVANVTSMSGSTHINGIEASWNTFYDKQKSLYSNANDSVTSGMIYGSQWDAIMKWMKDIDNPNVTGAQYINDSTGMGQYCYELCPICNGEGILDDWETECTTCQYGCLKITDTAAPIATGSNDKYKVKNIYDLAGNYYEWTQEAGDKDYRVYRGGYYGNTANLYKVSNRRQEKLYICEPRKF